ncbi:UNC93-like protein MFSD11 [Bradysia coprophila]|uniref:UNC93-like protein MFSD11 n=1 Tax=Bradysia coprophila TaxID=38358 RepID=UPI00187D71E2|nr:UNC93-like protein MFSD11 [Bradysia coprophila]
MERNFVNVIALGFGFMFLFTAFQTMGNIEKTILDSIAADDPTFKGDGYTSLAVIYGVLAICNWLAPSALSICGPRGAMFIGSITYCLFMVSFLWPQTWLLYAASGVLGVGAALIWTGQGTYLSNCSDSTTISRNSGVFWAMLQASMFLGNLFVYFQFQGKTHIDLETRQLVFGVLIGVAVIGIIFLATLRKSSTSVHRSIENIRKEEIHDGGEQDGITDAFKKAINLFFTSRMLLLSLTFIYTGLELSFFSGVYSPSIGFTLSLGESSKQLVGLSGICIGIGEVSGGVLFGLLGSKTNKFGRDAIVIAGFVVHIVSFILIFLNLPDSAPFGDTKETAFLNPPIASLALLCSFLLGFGDACFNTQIYAMLGGEFAKNTAAAFALFKFTQSVAAAASFIYSSHIGLSVQMGILIVTGIIGTACFCIVEWSCRRQKARDSVGAAAKLNAEIHSD